jgi:lysozyme
MILVVDVFEGNGPVDWGKVKAAGVSAAIHKATQYRVDQRFTAHHADIPRAGLHHGCYHFMAYNVGPAAQARLYVSTVGTPDKFGWVIDFERYQGQLPSPADLAALLNALPPGPVLLYGNQGDLATLGRSFNGKVKVWLASYGVNDGKPHGDAAAIRASTQFPAADVLLWQFTSTGRIDGITGYADVSMWLGTDAEWATYMGESGQVHIQSVGEEEDDMLQFTDERGTFRCDSSGAVYTFDAQGSPADGGRFLGGLNGHADWNAGAGKANGAPFAFGPTPPDAQGRKGYFITTRDANGTFHPYAFPGDGSLK